MYVVERLINFLRARLKAWGPSAIKREVWNKEFAEGRWDYIEQTSGDCIYRYIAKYCNRGAILDLGCGSGNTGNELDVDCYREYVGVDISDVAVQKAMTRTARNGRGEKNRYVQSDIGAYNPTQKFDLVLFRESLWYIPQGKLKAVLDKYKECMNESGVFIARIHDRVALKGLVGLIRNDWQVVEESAPEHSRDIVLVFR